MRAFNGQVRPLDKIFTQQSVKDNFLRKHKWYIEDMMKAYI